MQSILGSGGVIGVELAKALPQFTQDIRLVSRNPIKVNPTDELFTADLLQKDQLQNAIKASEVVYITVGFPYSYKVWKASWPPFISNLLDACEAESCKLVFFDNIYMYDPDYLNPMDEKSPIRPPSKKGTVRAKIAAQILDRIQSGRIKGLIARSADFYGPAIANTSILTETVIQPLVAGKTANWMANDEVPHSFTFTPDAGKATALLGNTEGAYGQVWHLPTAHEPPTGKEWVHMIANALEKPPKYRVVPKWMVKMMGWFLPIMKETHEMLYQYGRPYVFDSSKFEEAFDWTPTSYSAGIRQIVEQDKLK
jgi:nucleoside-diphosphate-sugar epimerase